MYQESFSNFFKQFRRTSFCFYVQYKQENGGELMEKYFLYDEHLGIEIPHLQEDWESIPKNAACYFIKMGTSSRKDS